MRIANQKIILVGLVVFSFSLLPAPLALAVNEVCPAGMTAATTCCVPPPSLAAGCPAGKVWIGSASGGGCRTPVFCPAQQFSCSTNACVATSSGTAVCPGQLHIGNNVCVDTLTVIRQALTDTVYKVWRGTVLGRLVTVPDSDCVDGQTPVWNNTTKAWACGQGDSLWLASGNDMSNTNTGNVGIGTSTPSATDKFSVYQSGAVSSYKINAYLDNAVSNSATDGINKIGLYVRNTGSFRGGSGAATKNYAVYTENFSNGADENYGLYSSVTAAGAGVTNYGAKLVATAGAGVTAYGLHVDVGTGSGTEYAAAFMNGNVGIGTETPSAKLEVAGGVTGDTPAPRLKFNDYYDNAGNPTISHIDLYGNAYGFGVSGSTLNYISDRYHKFYDNSSLANPTMTIDSQSGNVGIGLADPSSRLEIGTIRDMVWPPMFFQPATYINPKGIEVKINSLAAPTVYTSVFQVLGSGTTLIRGMPAMGTYVHTDGQTYGSNTPSDILQVKKADDNNAFTVKPDGTLEWGTTGSVLKADQGGSIELRGTAGNTPYIDFSNDANSDNDARLILAGDHTLAMTNVSSLDLEYNSNEGPRLLLRNPAKAGVLGNEWTIYNMTGGYGNSLQFWEYGGAGWGSRFTLESGGDVGIGTQAPATKLHVAGNAAVLRLEGSTHPYMEWNIGGTRAGWAGVGFNGSGDFGIYAENGKRLRLSAAAGQPVWIDSTINTFGNLNVNGAPANAYNFYVNGIAFASTGFFSSDARFKKDIISIESPTDKIMQMNGVLFNWKTDEYKDRNFPEGKHYGVIAQEVEKVLPEVVMTDSKNGEKSVAYTEIIPVLIEAFKDLHSRSETMKTLLVSQGDEIQALREEIAKLTTSR